jgi:hypothetical protein
MEDRNDRQQKKNYIRERHGWLKHHKGRSALRDYEYVKRRIE